MLVVRRLIWDAWNIAHIARHKVVPEEVEEVCHGTPIVLQTYADRLLVIGPAAAGRMLSVVLDSEGRTNGVYYVVTARPASRRERRIFGQHQGGVVSHGDTERPNQAE